MGSKRDSGHSFGYNYNDNNFSNLSDVNNSRPSVLSSSAARRESSSTIRRRVTMDDNDDGDGDGDRKFAAAPTGGFNTMGSGNINSNSNSNTAGNNNNSNNINSINKTKKRLRMVTQSSSTKKPTTYNPYGKKKNKQTPTTATKDEQSSMIGKVATVNNRFIQSPSTSVRCEDNNTNNSIRRNYNNNNNSDMYSNSNSNNDSPEDEYGDFVGDNLEEIEQSALKYKSTPSSSTMSTKTMQEQQSLLEDARVALFNDGGTTTVGGDNHSRNEVSSSNGMATESSTATTSSSPPTTSTSGTPAAPDTNADADTDTDNPAAEFSVEVMSSLIEIGFPEDEVCHCLRVANGDPHLALEYLMSGIPPGRQQDNANEKSENGTKERISRGKGKKKEGNIDNNNNNNNSKKKKQLTLTQLDYTVDDPTTVTDPTTPQPKIPIPKYVTHNGHEYRRGDVFYRKIDEKNRDNLLNNTFVTIIGFKLMKGKQLCAILDRVFYIPIEDTFIGSEEAATLTSIGGSNKFVKCITSSAAPPLTTSLSSLGEWRDINKNPIIYDYLYFIKDKYRRKSSSSSKKKGKATTSIEKKDESSSQQQQQHPSEEVCRYQSAPTNQSEKKKQFSPVVDLPSCGPDGKPTVLNLYTGGGGMSQGLKEAGFLGTHNVDSDSASCSTLQANFPSSKVYQVTVQDFLIGCRRNPSSSRYPPMGTLMLLHGSTPCQGFSLANRNGGANDDANNEETYQFMDVVEYYQPPFVTFENVEGMNTTKNRCYLQKMIARFLRMGYQVRVCSLNAADYGDPQSRQRIFILAAKEGCKLPAVPAPTHGTTDTRSPSLLRRPKTSGDVLEFLEEIDPLDYEGIIQATYQGALVELEGHIVKNAKRTPGDDDIQLTKGKPARSVLKKRIVRHYQVGKRPLTRLEQAQLQSFPPTYQFFGTDEEIRCQIGNAVPVQLATAIGRSVMKAIHESRNSRTVVSTRR